MIAKQHFLPVLGAILPTLLVGLLLVAPVLTWVLSVPAAPASARELDPHAIFWSTFIRTAYLAGLSSLLALLAGGSVAFLHVFSSLRTQRMLAMLMLVPLLIGYLARNYAWLGLLTAVPSASELLYSAKGVVLVTATVFVPVSFFLTLQGFASIRVEAIRSVRTLGASDWGSVRGIILPAVARQAAIAWALCFVLALGYFVTPRMIGGGNHDFVGNDVLRIIRDPGDIATASWIALDLLCVSVVPIVAIVWYSLHRRRITLGD